MLDLILIGLAFVPLCYRASELDLVPVLASTPVWSDPKWWLCLAGISLLYGLHGFIWNFPAKFTKLCAPTGKHPVEVFAGLEIVGKVWQISCLVALIGIDAVGGVISVALSAPAWCYGLFVLYVAIGQTLNMAMYAAIGNDGVYYGFRLGREVPWCSGFPFNVGLRHPQYVGVVLTIYGGVACLLSESLVRAGLVQAGVAWASMYIVMAIMEQLNDNDKSKGE